MENTHRNIERTTLREQAPNIAIIAAALGIFTFAIWKIANSDYEPIHNTPTHQHPTGRGNDRWELRPDLINNEERDTDGDDVTDDIIVNEEMYRIID